MTWRQTSMTLVAAMVFLAGCGDDDPFDPNRPRRNVGGQFAGQLAPVELEPDNKPATPSPPPVEVTLEGTAKTVAPPPPPPPPVEKASETEPIAEEPEETSPPQRFNTERVVAKAGVTGKGQYGGGLITTPIAAYFSVRERVVFDIQIPSTMNLYKAEHGRFPRTHKEFMQKIIKANGFVLPKLQSDEHRYIYLPEKAAKMRNYDTLDPPLMVERPD